jgi:hypothetical protein
MTRCPFSLSRLVKVTETGQVVYKAKKDACRAFPGWNKGDCTNFRGHRPGTAAQQWSAMVDENGTVPFASSVPSLFRSCGLSPIVPSPFGRGARGEGDGKLDISDF